MDVVQTAESSNSTGGGEAKKKFEGGRGGHNRGHKNKNNANNSSSNNSNTSKTKAAKLKDEVFLCMSVVASGRSPHNGWLLSLSAVAITAGSRRVLGLFERQLLPFAPDRYLAPAKDVADYLRRRRADLEYLYTRPGYTSLAPSLAPAAALKQGDAEAGEETGRGDTRVSVPAAMKDLVSFCEPFGNLTLVCSPLFSTYGWLSYYWGLVHGGEAAAAAAPVMPWGHSGLCARSFASGLLGVSMKNLSKTAAFQESFEGFSTSGVPLADALASGVSFSYLHARQARPGEAPPGVTFECAVPESLYTLGSIPRAHQPPAETLTLDRLILSQSLLDSLDAHAAEPRGFCVFPSITDVQRHASLVDLLPVSLREAEVWTASEKVHGANFTVSCTGTEVWAGRRLGPLAVKDAEAFYNYTFVLQEMSSAIRECRAAALDWVRSHVLPCAPDAAAASAVSAWLGTTDGEAVQVDIVCELAGGGYPHPRVPVDLRAVRVQTGISYSPSNFLYGIDVALRVPREEKTRRALEQCVLAFIRSSSPVVGAAIDAASGTPHPLTVIGRDSRYYLPPAASSAVLASAGFPACAVGLRRGALAALLADGTQIFDSTIATEQLRLPPLAPGTNAAEGLVVRPEHDLWIEFTESESSAPMRRGDDDDGANMGNGSEDGAEEEGGGGTGRRWARVNFKHKHPAFSEYTTRKLPGSSSSSSKETSNPNNAVDLADFLTEARVESVLSKYTDEQQRDHQAMVKAVLADALKDAKSFPKYQ